MAYRQDFANAARRHLAAAQQLQDCERATSRVGNNAVAGYLFGMAGELAVKKIMAESGMTPTGDAEDPFYSHFPRLKTHLRNLAHGRRQGDLLAIARNEGLFRHWDTDMRYAPSSDVQVAWTNSWRSQAERLVGEIGL
jgi:hypothetical protein